MHKSKASTYLKKMSIKKPRLLLISTNSERGGQYLSFGVLFIASYIRKYLGDEIDVKIADQNCEDVIQSVKRFNPDLVGISFTSINYSNAKKTAKMVKKLDNSKIVIVGGPHVSGLPEITMEYPYFDIGFISEAEKPFLRFLKKYLASREISVEDYKDIPGIVLKDKDKIYINTGSEFVEDLDEIPFINTDLINMKHYLKRSQLLRGLRPMRSFALFSSRGCPYRCFFCASKVISHNRCRYHSAEYVFNQMEKLYSDYKVKAFYFHDDLFMANKKRTEAICRLLIKGNLHNKIIWGCQTRVEIVLNSEDIIGLMKEAGCSQFEFGFESGNDRILRMLKGGSSTVANNQKAIDKVYRYGIKIYGNFMIGNYSETEEEIGDTISFIKKNIEKINFFGVYNAYPLPATPWWDTLVREKQINPRAFDFDGMIGTEDNPKSFSNIIEDERMTKFSAEVNSLGYKKIPLINKMRWFIFTVARRPRYVFYRIFSYFRLLRISKTDSIGCHV